MVLVASGCGRFWIRQLGWLAVAKQRGRCSRSRQLKGGLYSIVSSCDVVESRRVSLSQDSRLANLGRPRGASTYISILLRRANSIQAKADESRRCAGRTSDNLEVPGHPAYPPRCPEMGPSEGPLAQVSGLLGGGSPGPFQAVIASSDASNSGWRRPVG